jgi:hypothetical protein
LLTVERAIEKSIFLEIIREIVKMHGHFESDSPQSQGAPEKILAIAHDA